MRAACGIGTIDLGFSEQWLVADVRPHSEDTVAHLPKAAQFCDPARPHTVIANGRAHRRWEFRLTDEERAEGFTDDRVWELLRPWLAPSEAELVRHAVYRFRSQLSETMRDRRVLLAGDAAHLMPPFMGQGMCSGIRDAANVAWKLDLVLRGLADAALLDTVTVERTPQNRATIELSMMVGGIICIDDPQAARDRDTAMRAGQAPAPPPLPGLESGLVRQRSGSPDPLAGSLGVQGVVTGRRAGADADTTGLLDEVAGTGFLVLTGEPGAVPDDAAKFIGSVGGQVRALAGPGPAGLRDVDGALTAWLAASGRYGVVVRPDGYVFGSAGSPAELEAVLGELRERMLG